MAVVGSAHFFDAFDALTIAFAMPVLIGIWGLNPGETAAIISVGYVGQTIGAIAFGRAAESYGRRRMLRWTIGILSILTIAAGLAAGPVVFCILRFFQGLGLGGETPVGAAYINEICPTRWRGRAVFALQLIFAGGVVITAFAALWIIPHLGWRAMFWIGGLPLLLAIALPRLMSESPRWLADVGRLEEADQILMRVERDLLARGVSLQEPSPVARTMHETHPALAALFQSGYAQRTLALWLMALCTAIAGYGIVTWMPILYRTVFHLPIDIALRYGLGTTIAGFLGVLAATLLIDRIGRRWLFILGFGGGGLPLLYLALNGAHVGVQGVVILATTACTFLSFLLAGLYVYAPEIYPTRIRAIGAGAASAWLRFGSIIGPLLVGLILPSFGITGVFLLFGLAAITGAVTVFFFGIETLGRSLEAIAPR
ncbi:MAG TPA: MFS transporter [Sphingobium sp.]